MTKKFINFIIDNAAKSSGRRDFSVTGAFYRIFEIHRSMTVLSIDLFDISDSLNLEDVCVAGRVKRNAGCYDNPVPV